MANNMGSSLSMLDSFSSGRCIQRIIAGESGEFYGSLGTIWGTPGKSGLFKLSTPSTVTLLNDSGIESGFPALHVDITNDHIYALSSPNGIVLDYDYSATPAVLKHFGKLSNWFGGATDVKLSGQFAYVLRFSVGVPPVPYVTKMHLGS